MILGQAKIKNGGTETLSKFNKIFINFIKIKFYYKLLECSFVNFNPDLLF